MTESVAVVRAVTVIMGTVVGLTFLFGFDNVLGLARHLGVPIWVAPLVAPAVELSILGLLLAIRQLALNGATPARLRPARRLLIFASMVTLALNVVHPMVAGEYGRAAFDAVGPLLLIGWAEVGPGLLQAMSALYDEGRTSAGELPTNSAEPVTCMDEHVEEGHPALLRRRKQGELSAVLPQSDGADEFCEDRCERMPSIDVRAEFVVAPTEILDERVSGTDPPG